MERQGKKIGGLALVLTGVLGVGVACGLPMWRETSFVGANIITAQSVWDGLWLHCVIQATGQMQCKKHTSCITMTSDIQAGRALTLLSIVTGLLGFIVTLLQGGVANCWGTPPEPIEPQTTKSSRKKGSLVGGALCVLAGILSLSSVSWSAAATISMYNNPLVAASLKRDVGSSIYIGGASSLLLLLGGALISFVCGEREPSQPSNKSCTSHSTNSAFSMCSTCTGSLRSAAVRSNHSRMLDHHSPRRMGEQAAQVDAYNSPNKAQSGVGLYNQFQEIQPGNFWPYSVKQIRDTRQRERPY